MGILGNLDSRQHNVFLLCWGLACCSQAVHVAMLESEVSLRAHNDVALVREGIELSPSTVQVDVSAFLD